MNIVAGSAINKKIINGSRYAIIESLRDMYDCGIEIVNSAGDLNTKGLRDFKVSMNPIDIINVYSMSVVNNVTETKKIRSVI